MGLFVCLLWGVFFEGGCLLVVGFFVLIERLVKVYENIMCYYMEDTLILSCSSPQTSQNAMDKCRSDASVRKLLS